MRILLIAGHGAGDSGACGNGYREADVTREVVALLNERFRGVCAAEVADTSKNWFEYLGSHNFNFTGYDYVLEIHFNSGGGTGAEIFVTTSERRIGVETAIVKQISNTVGYRNRGVKRTNFRVISRVKAQGVSSALLEVCFIDNASDVNTYQDRKSDIANAIVNGIAEGFGLKQSTPSHWAERYCNKLIDLGYITDDSWKNYDCDLPVSYALALLDKTTGGTWKSDEADTSVHWAQPIIISLCGKGLITDKDLYIDLVRKDAKLSNALCLALFNNATGGMCKQYIDRNTDHWARNCLDSLCDKAVIHTPDAWTNFEAATTYGRYIAIVCGAFNIM